MALRKKQPELPPIQPKPIMPIITPQPIPEIKTPELSIPTSTKELTINKQGDEEPFFVRIDKFNSAKDNFSSINKKVRELDNVINTLERIKEKEANELNEWKEQASSVKELLLQIDKEIFGKL